MFRSRKAYFQISREVNVSLWKLFGTLYKARSQLGGLQEELF